MRRSSGALIHRLNLSVSSQQRQGAASNWLHEAGVSHGAASDNHHIFCGRPCIHVLEALGLRSLATRSRLSLKGTKSLALKRRHAAAEAAAAMASPHRSLGEEEEILSSRSLPPGIGRGDADDMPPPLPPPPSRPLGGKASRFGQELELDEAAWGAGGGAWGNVGNPKDLVRQKVPAFSTGITASHAEFFYEDEPAFRRAAGRAAEHGRGWGRVAAAEEAEAAVSERMVHRDPEHRPGRGKAAAATAAMTEEAEAGGLSGVPYGRSLPRMAGKGLSVPPLSTALGGLGMGALAAAQAGRHGAAERDEEGGDYAEGQEALSERGGGWGGRGAQRGVGGSGSGYGAGRFFQGQGELDREGNQYRRGRVEEMRSSGQVGQDGGTMAPQAQPMTLTQLKQQANLASEPEHVLKVLQSADHLLEWMRASTKPSPQLDKQVAGVHALLHHLSLQLLPSEQHRDATANKTSTPPKKSLHLSAFHGLQLARMLRLLGKTGSLPPVAVQEGIISELLADDCQKLLTASPLAWVQVLQGMQLIRNTWGRLQHQQGQADPLHRGLSHELTPQDGVDGWSSTLTRTEESGTEVSTNEGARTVQSPQLANLEHDLMEVISSMLIAAAQHMEPDTVVMVGAYLSRLHNCKRELFEAIAGVLASERHRLSNKTASQLGMLARSLANPPKMYVPSLLDKLAALVIERKAAYVTSQGWPDLLRAYSQHLHPCPGLVGLLADSADRHLPRLSFQKLTSLVTSVMLLEPHTPQGLCLLQAICATTPAKLGDPAAKGSNAARMLHVLAAARFCDPACLQPLLAATTADWLPQLTALAASAQQHAAQQLAAQQHAAQQDAAAQQHAAQQPETQQLASQQHAAQQDAAAQQHAPAVSPAEASARDASKYSDAAANDAAAAAATIDSAQAKSAIPDSVPGAPTSPDHAPTTDAGTAAADPVPATPATSHSAQDASTPPDHALDHAATGMPTSSDHAAVGMPTSLGLATADTLTPSARASIAMVALMARASALTDAMFKSSPPRAAEVLDAAWKSARPASLLTHMHNTPYQQLLHPLAKLADVGVLSRTQSACLAEALAMSMAVQEPIPPHAHTSASSGIHSGSSSSSRSNSIGVNVSNLNHASHQQTGGRSGSGIANENSDGSGVDGGAHEWDDGQMAQHSAHSTASQTDLLLSFVHSALHGPLSVGGNLETFKIRTSEVWSQSSSPGEEEHTQSLFAGAAYDGSSTNSNTGVHSHWSLPTYRRLMAHSLAMARALGLGKALHAPRGVHEPTPHAGLPAYMRPWVGAVQQPAMPDVQFVSALLGGHTPVQEVLYRVPSEPQEQEHEHSSLHAAQLGLQTGGWEAASEAMKVDNSSMSEGNWKESESEVDVPWSMSTNGSDGNEKDSSGEEGSNANSGSKGDEVDGSSSSSSSSSSIDEERGSGSSSKDNDKWSVETQASRDQESAFDSDTLRAGDTSGTESMAALQHLLLRAGTRQSEASYETLLLASTISSVLLGQGASSPPMQQLLVADGRLVIAGAVHHSSWAADGIGSSSEHKPRSDEGSSSSNSSSNDETISGSTASAVIERGMPHGVRQDVAPHTPVAVLLVRPEDFCQTVPTATESSVSNGSRTQLRQQEPQQQHQTPMGDLVLRRWLLRAAGVRVVEVAEAEWAAVMKHEAAASLIISEALQQQQHK